MEAFIFSAEAHSGVGDVAMLGGWAAGSDPCGNGPSDNAVGRWEGVLHCGPGGLVRTLILEDRKDLGAYKLSGRGLQNLTGLGVLNLANTNLLGTLPPEIGSISGLYYLALARTLLSGTLPPEIGLITGIVTVSVFFHNTRMSGTLPPEIDKPVSLSDLFAYHTNISGTIPPGLAKHSSSLNTELQASTNGGLHLHSTKISGTLPSGLCLDILDFHDCRLDGNGTATLDSCTGLKVLDLSQNLLTTLPEHLPTSLTHLYIGSNPLAVGGVEFGAVLRMLPNLASLDVAFFGLHVQTGYAGDKNRGTRVTVPGGCRVGFGAPPCKFTLQLYDNQSQVCGIPLVLHNLL
jgi:hypothetical protein